MWIVRAVTDALPSHRRTVYARTFYEPDAFSRQSRVMEKAGEEGKVSHSFNERMSVSES